MKGHKGRLNVAIGKDVTQADASLQKSTKISCSNAHPPTVHSFEAVDVGDSYVVLQWTADHADVHFVYEITSRRVGDLSERQLIVPHTQSTALIRQLKSNTNYTASLFAMSKCYRAKTMHLIFQTQPTRTYFLFTFHHIRVFSNDAFMNL
ncbi:hypothetical protein AB6A40_010387 [Gnathostoma spinigerum]|uniref:Fibronectin type-III domain-containing protein n=1 Tax=Gnathostoma spinigerum TaxID=75299 RepID=A0ABD6EUQ5_9BILA